MSIISKMPNNMLCLFAFFTVLVFAAPLWLIAWHVHKFQPTVLSTNEYSIDPRAASPPYVTEVTGMDPSTGRLARIGPSRAMTSRLLFDTDRYEFMMVKTQRYVSA